MELKAKRSKGKYKNTDKWLDAVYRNNKKLIDQRLSTVSVGKLSKRRIFKDIVHEYMENGASPTKALHKAANSTIFLPERNRLVDNALKGLRSSPDAFKQFRELTKEKGRYTKIDPTKFIWQDGAYIYDNVRISFSNSPLEIFVGRIDS